MSRDRSSCNRRLFMQWLAGLGAAANFARLLDAAARRRMWAYFDAL